MLRETHFRNQSLGSEAAQGLFTKDVGNLILLYIQSMPTLFIDHPSAVCSYLNALIKSSILSKCIQSRNYLQLHRTDFGKILHQKLTKEILDTLNFCWLHDQASVIFQNVFTIQHVACYTSTIGICKKNQIKCLILNRI